MTNWLIEIKDMKVKKCYVIIWELNLIFKLLNPDHMFLFCYYSLFIYVAIII